MVVGTSSQHEASRLHAKQRHQRLVHRWPCRDDRVADAWAAIYFPGTGKN
jgi:hypothetical protein